MARFFFFFGIASLAQPAFAYLDPGTGSIILQGIIAGVAMAWLAMKGYYYKILGFFGKKEKKSILEDAEDDDRETRE